MTSNATLKLAEAVSFEFIKHRSLSLERLISLIYLCDWKHLLDYNSSITNTKWFITNNKIENPELLNELIKSKVFKFDDQKPDENINFSIKVQNRYEINSSEMNVCRHIVEALITLSDFKIETAVLSTYPFTQNGNRPLETLAEEYQPIYNERFPLPDIA